MAYIANRPVRFDRNYTVGEVIPAEVIEPKMARRLVDMGRILCVDIPETGSGAGGNPDPQQPDDNGAGEPGGVEAPQEAAQETQEGAESAEGTNTQDDEEKPQDGQEKAADGDADAPQEGAGEPGGVEAPQEEYICPICGKGFNTKNGLSAHSRTHRE